MIWDSKRATESLLDQTSNPDPELRGSAADSLLLWHALQFISKRIQVFDLSVIGH
jgi:hypothetical protein